MMFSQLLVRLTAVYLCVTTVIVSAGVYPNYRANFEFVSLDENTKNNEKSWWQTASFYQIYPRSFKDSNGDGVGDLNGITERLAYLKEIDVTATWLSPIFKSPMADFGYDITSFTEIDPIFGTMKDFDALIKKAKEIGVKIILDFVPNHTSDECIWFQKSVARDPKYKDYYIWHPGKMINGTRHPPCNWLSVFRGSAWTWNEQRKEYYFHQFLNKQPDLNYRNPKVHDEMKEVLRFWLKKGVAGFRIDAVPHVYEVSVDPQGNCPDEPRQEWVTDPDDYGYLQHVYTVDQPETIDIVYEWRSVLDQFWKENGGDERIMMTEAYSPIEILMKYYGNATSQGAQIPFNFLMISSLNKNSNAYDYAEAINIWLKNMPEGRTANWVMGNHDQNRVGSRLGVERIDLCNMLLLTLPGCSITYMGEEIGMTDVWISWNDTVDPSACNSNPSIYERLSRDPERTPFQWSDDKNAGFSIANKTWLPLSPDYSLVNVKRERGITRSHLNLYKELKNIRQEAALRNGATDVKVISNNVFAIKRFILNDYVYITLVNVMENVENVNLNVAYSGLPTQMEYIAVTDKSARRKSDKTFTDSIVLMPWEAVLLRSLTKLTTTFGYYTYFADKV